MSSQELTGREVRESFLSFFEERGHRRVPSASVLPESDPTLLFVNAGMVPFKRVFLGEESRDYRTAASSQKCIRVSGKHNDLENVGRTARHHTFFEMLGNFSFGDYFKEEAIRYAWELVTRVWGLEPERLAVSVFREDDDAASIWEREIGLPSGKIYRLDEKENFWSMGDTGPCGPCSELHIDFGETGRCRSAVCDPSCECGRWLEFWNLVFMQFDRDASGKMTPLPKPCVDTGAGLERVTMILQGVATNYDTDLFTPILARAQELSGVALGSSEEQDVSLKVVADHARSCTFMIGDGVLPENEGRGYVLRRILRRAARHGYLLGMERPFLYEVAGSVIDEMSGAYPEIGERRAFIQERIQREEERFLATLANGMGLLEDEVAKLEAAGETRLAGEVVFRLYDTFGFPVDLTEDVLASRGLAIDQAGFELAMGAQRERSREAWKGTGDEQAGEVFTELANAEAPRFLGYETLSAESEVRALVRGGAVVGEATTGDEVDVISEETPFYAESGGQVGDRGVIRFPGGLVEVRDTTKPAGDLIVHHGVVAEGAVGAGERVVLEVDAVARAATVRNHTGTHLLHAALREVVGPQAMQKGSLVAPERLRFDFTHDAPLSQEQLDGIEDRVNAWVAGNADGSVRELPYRDAIEAGAIAIFEEKYGDTVRVVSFGDVSTELCGGTHARATGDIGLLKIVSEGGVAAGVRRIEALTGLRALHYLREQERRLQRTGELLKVPAREVPARVERLLEERREKERELQTLEQAKRGAASVDLAAAAREVAGTKVLAARAEGVSGKELRGMVDDLRGKLGSGVVLLAAESEGRVALALGVTKDLVGRFKAGELIADVAAVVGGKGGGRPDFAQAGGRDPGKIDEALARVIALVEEGAAP